jgi:hypothetical protein
MVRLQFITAFVVAATIAILGVTSLDTNPDNWERVPGGRLVHKSCIREVPSGVLVDDSYPSLSCTERLPPPSLSLSLSSSINPNPDPFEYHYAIDTHWNTTNVTMLTFDATFQVPGEPPVSRSQTNFIWPGFKGLWHTTHAISILRPLFSCILFVFAYNIYV